MAILPDRAHSSIRYQDHQLYFCSASCESKFVSVISVPSVEISGD
ncbi:YHS domain-containing protein [Klebsiella pneumoniae]|nr:YHS domain-containing protein [Klebsiella pneumoniae]MDK1832463.1 YHS domain-containing protein [Klebsiella sp. K5-212]MDK1894572.1 YHS domain-containing protein [Klebsiella sp. K4-180]MDK1967647.1 YHS domain-containing protein [Klebsiella sp. K5-229]MDK1988947.1 YHS domain-containing protein [Klebsiella sp. K6-123-1]